MMSSYRTASASSSNAVRERRARLLTQADTITYEKNWASAGVFLCERLDLDILEDILDDLDAGPLRIRAELPVDAPLPDEIADTEKPAHDSLRDLSLVLHSLYRAARAEGSPKVQTLFEKCLEKVCERWTHVAQWIMLCAQTISPADPFIPGHWRKVMHFCTGIIEPIVFESGKSKFKREIATNKATIDILFRLLRITQPRTGRPAILEDSGTRSTCAIARLFAIYVVSDVGNSVPSRLNSLPLETKEQVVQSIIERIQDVVQKPRDTPEAMDIVSDDLLNLIPSSCKLAEGMGEGGGFAHRDILFEGARALSSIMEDAALKGLQKPKSITLDAGINSLVTVAISHSIVPRALDGLLEGGIISCILRSLPYANMDDPRSQGLKGPAWRLLPFLTDSRFYNAAKTGGGAPDLLKELGDTPRSKIVESIYNSYSLVLRLGKIAFGETRDAVQMCYSLKHQLPAERSVDLAALKTCSTCHAAYYCSRECQKEDWSTFHSVECIRALTRWRPNLKDAGMTERIERDKLAFIEVLANRFLPPLPDIIAREKSSNNANSQPGKNVNDRVRVHIFDLAGKLFRESKSLKLMEYECTTLSAYFKKHEHVIGDRTQARLGQAAKDVELDPESGVLVAGTFTGHHIIVCICAKMQYNPKGAVGERYRAVTHACSVQTMPPAVFEFASKMGMLNI